MTFRLCLWLELGQQSLQTTIKVTLSERVKKSSFYNKNYSMFCEIMIYSHFLNLIVQWNCIDATKDIKI